MIGITAANKPTLYLDCSNDSSCTNWFRAFEKARKSHEEEMKRKIAPKEYMKTLGIDPGTQLSQKAITRAYRKLSLKVLISEVQNLRILGSS